MRQLCLLWLCVNDRRQSYVYADSQRDGDMLFGTRGECLITPPAELLPYCIVRSVTAEATGHPGNHLTQPDSLLLRTRSSVASQVCSYADCCQAKPPPPLTQGALTEGIPPAIGVGATAAFT